MKSTTAKLSLSVAIATLLAQVVYADTPTFYGAIYLNAADSEEKITKTYTDGTREQETTKGRLHVYDNGSRLGVRGSNSLNNDIELQYRVEVRAPVDGDTTYVNGKEVGKGRSFEMRDAWVGIKHNKYGTFKAGRLLTPEPYVNYLSTTLPTPYTDGFRANNNIRWESPVFKDGALKDTQVMIHYTIKEKNSTDSHGTDAIGVFVNHTPENAKYAIGGAYLYADADKQLHYGKIKDSMRITGKYDLTDQYTISAMYQQNRFNDKHYGDVLDSKTESGLAIGGSYKANKDSKTSYYAQANIGKNPQGKEGDTKALIIGGQHDFTDKIFLGMEAGYYQNNFDVPNYTEVTQKDGVQESKTIKAHKLKQETGEILLFSGVRF